MSGSIFFLSVVLGFRSFCDQIIDQCRNEFTSGHISKILINCFSQISNFHWYFFIAQFISPSVFLSAYADKCNIRNFSYNHYRKFHPTFFSFPLSGNPRHYCAIQIRPYFPVIMPTGFSIQFIASVQRTNTIMTHNLLFWKVLCSRLNHSFNE